MIRINYFKIVKYLLWILGTPLAFFLLASIALIIGYGFFGYLD